MFIKITGRGRFAEAVHADHRALKPYIAFPAKGGCGFHGYPHRAFTENFVAIVLGFGVEGFPAVRIVKVPLRIVPHDDAFDERHEIDEATIKGAPVEANRI